MSLVIFFGFSFLVFLAGVTMIVLTVHHWYKESRQNKINKKKSLPAAAVTETSSLHS